MREEHMTQEGGEVLAHTLLWCFCCGSPLADLLLDKLARQGGHMLVNEITGEVPGHVNFRTILGEATAHPLTHLFPDPRDMQVAGRA
jgi:hypothetical protein